MTSTAPPIPDLAGREALWMGGRLIVIHHAPEAGATEPCVTESWLNAGQGPEECRHRYIDLTYYLIEGQMDFSLAGEVSPLRQGTMVFVPRGTRHTYCVTSQSGARVLVMGTPGQPWVDYVRAIGFPATAATMPPPDLKLVPMEYVKRVAAGNGLEFTGARLPGASRGGHE
jgi:mannose-6-phosphate isomerase-like protein (cupin superfamily)